MSIASQISNADIVVESVSPVMAQKLYTPDELLALPDEKAYELVGGNLVERNMGGESSRLAQIINTRLDIYADDNGLGMVWGPDASYQIFGEDANQVRRPDGSFIAKGRLPNDLPPKGHIRIVPDLVVEVVSPNDLAAQVDVKIEEYLHAGVRLIWIVFPETRRIYAFRAGDTTVQRLGVEDKLSGEDVLPGFALAISKIFPVASNEAVE